MLRTRVGLATPQWMLTRGGSLRDGEGKNKIGDLFEQWYVIDSSFASPSSCAGFQNLPVPPDFFLTLISVGDLTVNVFLWWRFGAVGMCQPILARVFTFF